jgi:hypothetical protein
MDQYKRIEALFAEGWDFNSSGDAVRACDKWLEAWEITKELFTEGIAEDVFDLNDKYKWTHFPSNYVQYLEMELHNAGIDDKTYFQKRIVFCQELLCWCGTDEATMNNTRIALGEAYYWSGDESSGQRLFEDWIRDDPDCGRAYSGWAGCYSFNSGEPQYERAEAILLDGYARSGLRDSECVIEGLVNIYEDMGDADKVGKFKKIYSELYPSTAVSKGHHKPTPVRAEKVGRNDPCPCGSGKKYKKCCLPKALAY